MSSKGAADESKKALPYDGLAEAKLLLRSIRAGSLATLVADSGYPFASLVNVATDTDGSPILLLSQLAAHTRQLTADARLSLLLARSGPGDPLAHPRLTILGKARRISEGQHRAALRARFLARHPKSSLYADFGDFSFWRIEMDHVHLNGGFGRAGSFDAALLRTPLAGADALIAAESDVLAELNSVHASTLALLARNLPHAPEPDGAGEWSATGVDPEGLDLMREEATARLVFRHWIGSPADLPPLLEELG
jgi:putative heme iron utilization protein